VRKNKMNTQKINELRIKYETANMKTFEEMDALLEKIGDNKFNEVMTGDQLKLYWKGYYAEKERWA
jgi:uncharacterized lipoprotein YehR (DUF1307 family)